jgi:hypothetical protein
MMLGASAQEKQASPESTTGDKPPKPSEEKAQGGKDGAKDRNAAPSRSFATGLPPAAGSYNPGAVLARNLSPEVQDRLRRQGYVLKARPGSGLVEVRLPTGLDPWTAQRALELEFQQGFALNFVYELFTNFFELPIGKKKETQVFDQGPYPATSRGCPNGRCYAPGVIGWHDGLRACAEGLRIGIIDTGYDKNHKALAGIRATVVMEVDDKPKAPDWHGTGVTALLAGNPASSTPGVLPDAVYLIANAFFDNGRGAQVTDTVHVISALEALERAGAKLINMSMSGPRDQLVREKIRDMARNKGIVFIAAAGNGGPAAPPGYPAAYDEVIAVTAVDERLQTYPYANRGSYIDVSAPGTKIVTAYSGNQEVMASGTSYAAPFVTAIAAVSYKASSLPASISRGQVPFDPKGAILRALSIRPLGDDGARNNQYGLGLAKAPTTACPPASQPTAAPAKKAPPAVPSAWGADVKRTSGL